MGLRSSGFAILAALACFFLLCDCGKSNRDNADIDRALDMIDLRWGGIPQDFPKDVPIYPGLRGVTVVRFEGVINVSGASDDTVEKVVSYYETALVENGWSEDEPTTKAGSMLNLRYSQIGRSLCIGVARDHWDKTAIHLIVDERVLSPAAARVAQRPDSPEARQIVDRMAEVYASCSTYRDEGRVETVYFERVGESTETLRFRTAFVRPDRFRFEYVDASDRYVIHSDSNGTRTWWDVTPGVEEEDSLELALAGATGISSGSAHTIPSLLLNEAHSFRLTDLTELMLLPDANLDGVSCYRIQGKNRGGDVESLWIEKKTYLLRRIDTGMQFSDFRTEETTTYSPQVNVDVPPEELEFYPSGLISVPLWSRIAEAVPPAYVIFSPDSPEFIVFCLVAGSALCLAAAGCLALVRRMRKRVRISE